MKSGQRNGLSDLGSKDDCLKTDPMHGRFIYIYVFLYMNALNLRKNAREIMSFPWILRETFFSTPKKYVTDLHAFLLGMRQYLAMASKLGEMQKVFARRP